ncbi:hypothetical protein [Mesobacillus subterraneus]|uniref:YolD-like family protein n=1 Tax=Mesobacillus subterraneus TaxID=285983 RepID=A0A0D6ZDG0_9BACI|nr:hypothetical protein [Mesobacillus subterraneus]KIY22623.1 hypothetical protein UB32_07550 [Mesobacillus subterraneus]
MFLKKLIDKNPITIQYNANGSLAVFKGRVYGLNVKEQILSLKDEKQKTFSIRFSEIRAIY